MKCPTRQSNAPQGTQRAMRGTPASLWFPLARYQRSGEARGDCLVRMILIFNTMT